MYMRRCRVVNVLVVNEFALCISLLLASVGSWE